MKQNLIRLVCAAAALSALGLGAASVSEADVRYAARAWRAGTDALGTGLGAGISTVTAQATTNGATYYAVKLAGRGTVFMNADDELEPVLGFTSATNDLTKLDEKSPLYALLNRDVSREKAALDAKAAQANASGKKYAANSDMQAKWAKLIKAGQLNKASAVTSQSGVSDLRVPMIMQTKWSQSSVSGHPCYNYYIPNNYSCGCIATAMGQVMRTLQYPTASMAQFTRTCTVNGTSVDETSKGGTYDWSNMPLEPASTSYSSTKWEAIGKLIYDAAVSVNMDWDSTGGGALGSEPGMALRENFGYANALLARLDGRLVSGGSSRLDDLRKVFFANFDVGHPVIVGIPGHEVVADGYGFIDETDYVHFNMGWTGQSDYWYNIPDLTKAGSSYNAVDDVIYNIFTTEGSGTAVLSGRVLNTSGTAISGATVTITSTDGSVTKTVTTSSTGVWGAILAAGTYNVRAESGSLKGLQKCLTLTAPTTTTAKLYSNSTRSVEYATTGNWGNSWGNDVTIGTAAYARYADGAFTYYDVDMNAVSAPEGGMNASITVLFKTAAEYATLAANSEALKAKAFELEADVSLASATDWTAKTVEFAGHTVKLVSTKLSVANVPSSGTVTVDDLIANGDFQTDTVTDTIVSATPTNWNGSGVSLVNNNSDYADSQADSSNWCFIPNGSSITQEITVPADGSYIVQFVAACKNNTQTYWHSVVYCNFDDGDSLVSQDLSYSSTTLSATATLTAGTHTLKIGCSSNQGVNVDNVTVKPAGSTLVINVPSGETAENTGLTLSGGAAMRLEKTGAGSLKLTKANAGFGASGVTALTVKEGLVTKGSGNTCGAQYSTIAVENGGQIDIGARGCWDYDYTLAGSGPDGLGALVNTVASNHPWYSNQPDGGYIRNVTLTGDTTIGGTEQFSLSFWASRKNTTALNGHTLTIGGSATIYSGSMYFTGEGTISIASGSTFCCYDFYDGTPSIPDATLEVKGTYQSHGNFYTPVKNLIFTSTGTYLGKDSATPTCTVTGTYKPNATVNADSYTPHPFVTLGDSTTLDLSDFTETYDNTDTNVTFAAASTVTVNFGSRTLANKQKVVSWLEAPSSVTFAPAGTDVDGLSLIAKDDGLYVSSVPAYAKWDVATGAWKYYTAADTVYSRTWEDGVTSEIEVRFSSVEEFNAIKAQSVTPSKFTLTGLSLAAGTETYDLTGLDFSILKGAMLDLHGNKVKLPASVLSGDAFSVGDSTSPSAATVPALVKTDSVFWLDANDVGTLNIDENGKVLAWTSKSANAVTAVKGNNAPAYSVMTNGMPVVDLGTAGSDTDMTYTRFTNLRTVFWVVKIQNTPAAFLLGDTEKFNFHRGENGQYAASYGNYKNIWNGTNAVNMTSDVIPSDDYQVISAVMASDSWSNQLTKDRNCSGRHGGKQLAELICFSTELSDEDRTTITQYLQQKWFASVTPGELILDVPAGTTADTSKIQLFGHVKLVKTGAGTLTASTTAASYAGGTEVAGGQLTVGNNACLGLTPGTVQVDADATLEINGVEALIGYDFVLNGGTIQNAVSGLGTGNCQLAKVRLTANSTMKAVESFGLIGGGYAATTLDLGGYTLAVDIASGKTFYLYNADVTKGTLSVTGDGILDVEKTSCRASETTFLVAAAMNVVDPLAMGTYVPLYTGSSDAGTGAITVSTFKANGNAYRAFTFTENATLDVSALAAAADASQMTIPDGATLKVAFGSRTVAGNEKVVAWSSAPSNVKFVPAGENLANISLVPQADGLYTVTDTPEIATWDLENNTWKYWVNEEKAYEGTWAAGITSSIEVRFASLAEFNAIKAQSVTPKDYLMTGLTLAAGSATYDFTGAFDFTVSKDATIDLKGNTLKLPSSALAGEAFTVTDSTAPTTNLDASVAQSITAPSVLSKACFWLDALDTSTLNIDADGKVQTWTSKDANHVVATATTAPTYSATGYDIPTVDFGTTGSGLDMTYTRFTGMRTVFWVMKIEPNINAFMLGDTSAYNFHRGNNGAYGYAGYAQFASVWNGTSSIDWWWDKIPSTNSFQVISVTSHSGFNSDSLTNDRNIAGRNGGRQLSELICFDTVLADVQRAEVVEYLQKKWLKSQTKWTAVTGGGELVVDVPEGTTLVNSSLTLTGSAKLVKTGAGTYQPGMAQTYEGGTRVEAGTLALNAEQGLGTGDITVSEGATFDVNGSADTTNNVVVLDGGTLANTGADLAETTAELPYVRLTKDSTVTAAANFGLVGEAAALVLSEHTLTVNVASGKSFYLGNALVTKGAMTLAGDGALKTVGDGADAKDAAFTVGTALDLEAPLAIGDYVPTYTGTANAGTAPLTVYGTYKPSSVTPHAFTFGSGATFDLADLTAAYDATTVSFAENAFVTVQLGTRTLEDNQSLATLAAAPKGVSFLGVGDNMGSGRILSDATSLYVSLATVAIWTAENGSAYTNAEHWTTFTSPSGTTDARYVIRGKDCIDPFATDTVGLTGTIDLGGATQNFTQSIDAVLLGEVVLKNGNYNLNYCCNWAATGRNIYIDQGAVVNFMGRIYSGDGSYRSIQVRNGGTLNMPYYDFQHQVGRYKNSTQYLYVYSGSHMTAAMLRVGWDTNGNGNFQVWDHSDVHLTRHLFLLGRDSGGGSGYAYIRVDTGSLLQVDSGIYYGYYPGGSCNFYVQGGSTLKTTLISHGGYNDKYIQFYFNDATFVPMAAGVNIFDDSYSHYQGSNGNTFHITGNTLTVSNTVGKVTIGSVVDGVGAFRLTGGQDLEFTAVPTYTGATTVEAGTLTYPGCTTTGLTVKDGATLVYTNDIPNLASLTLEPGAALKMNVVSEAGEADAAELTVADAVNVDGVILTPTGLESWNQVEARLITATAITGTPVVPDGLKAEIVNNADGTVSLWLEDANMLPIAQRPITATYLGDGDTNGYANAENWICYNVEGGKVEGAVPVYYTTVVLANETAFTYPSDLTTSFPIKGISLATNVTLTADCDWKYFQPITIPDGCTLNLGGHTLDVTITAAQAAQVKGTGKITVDVPADTTETMDVADWGFAKSGAGELKVRVTEVKEDADRLLSITAGQVTIVDETDHSQVLTNVFSTASTGIGGTLDLGGTVQTFANVMDAVYNTGAKTINGTLLLSNSNWTSLGAKTITFGTNLVMTCWNHLSAPYGSPTINFQDGCHCEFVNGEHQLGTYRSPAYYINITSKAYVHITGYLRLGAGIYSFARISVDDATLITDSWIDLGTRVSGSQNGDGQIYLQNGAYLECYGIHASGRTDLGGGDATLLIYESTLKCRYNRLWGYQNNRFYSYFRNAVIIPTVSSTEANEELFYHYNPQIQSGFLTISNTVGLVRINTTAYGAGGFEAAGGSTNVECVTRFEVAPTYTGETKVTGGALRFPELTSVYTNAANAEVTVTNVYHSSKVLTVGAQGIYQTGITDTNVWDSLTFEDGAKIQIMRDRSDRSEIDLYAKAITNLPSVVHQDATQNGMYRAKVVPAKDADGSAIEKLRILYLGSTFIFFR